MGSGRRGWRLARCALALAASAWLCGCPASGRDMTPEQAFMLSASALSGSDRFFFEGELRRIGPSGEETSSRFAGHVDGHRTAALDWAGADGAKSAPRSDPLALLETLRRHAGPIAYAPPGEPGEWDEVTLTIALEPAAARDRMAALLRAELEAIRREEEAKLSASASGGGSASLAQRRRIIRQAERELEEALSTLQAATECRWTAERRSWMPLRLEERTQLRYRQGGGAREEERLAVIRFSAGGRRDTMIPNETS